MYLGFLLLLMDYYLARRPTEQFFQGWLLANLPIKDSQMVIEPLTLT